MQALANNLMSRAVQLSRHDAVSPTSAASMCITITQLQLQQAQKLGDSATMPAIALLTAAYQQLAAAGEVAVAAGGEMQEAVGKLKQEVGHVLAYVGLFHSELLYGWFGSAEPPKQGQMRQ